MEQENQTKKLIKNLEELNEKLDKRNSVLYNFGLSIVKGVGSLIGATIVATILLGLLSQVASSANDIPILKNIVDVQEVNRVLNTDN